MLVPTHPFRIPKKLKDKPASQPQDYDVQLEPLGIQAGLEPYTAPLDPQKAVHLLRRTALGAAPEKIIALLGRTADEVIDEIIEAATNPDILPLPDEPEWADTPFPPPTATQAEIQEYIENNNMWIDELRGTWVSWLYRGGLREKLTLFWHNHFVTGIDAYNLAVFANKYVSLLRSHCLGNLKNFVYDIGLDPAMMVYLNGNQNVKTAPNENYARELLELFTMSQKDRVGNDNYTQTDIEEIARALTGWIVDYYTNQSDFIPGLHDETEKTIFGQIGAFGYDDVVDIVFEERGVQTAYYICSKLYKEFIYAAPDPDIVQEMADILVANNFELAPVMSTLLKSAHFFDDAVIGARIKSPIELIAGSMLDVSYEPPPEIFSLFARGADLLEQIILNPPNVAGWKGHRFWVSTSTLPFRWIVSDFLLYAINENEPLDLVPFAQSLPEASDPYAAFKLPIAMAERLMAVPLDTLDLASIAEPFGGDLISNPIPEDILNGPPHTITLAKAFLIGIPWYEWSLEEPGANFLLLNFARYLMQLPEYHLT